MACSRHIVLALLCALWLTPVFSSPAKGASKATEELRLAIDKNDAAAVKAAIAHGANVNARFSHGSSALMLASEGGNVSMVKALLANGADLHSQCGCGWTVLMHAAAGGDNVAMLQLLLAHGAAVNEETAHQNPQNGLRTALQTAAFFGSAANVRFLLAHGASVKATNTSGKTALLIARKSKPASGDVLSLLKAATVK